MLVATLPCLSRKWPLVNMFYLVPFTVAIGEGVKPLDRDTFTPLCMLGFTEGQLTLGLCVVRTPIDVQDSIY